MSENLTYMKKITRYKSIILEYGQDTNIRKQTKREKYFFGLAFELLQIDASPIVDDDGYQQNNQINWHKCHVEITGRG